MLSSDQVDKDSFHGNAQPFMARRQFCQFRCEGRHIAEVVIRAPRECPKLRADTASQSTSGQHDQFVTLNHQDIADRQQRIDMAGCGRRSH
jgi:hypothetical protein